MMNFMINLFEDIDFIHTIMLSAISHFSPAVFFKSFPKKIQTTVI